MGCCVAAGRILSLEITGQILLRVSKDFDDRPTVIDREALVPRVLLAPGKNLPHAPVDRLLGFAWERIELRRVNHVAAGIAHQALVQVELPQRSALTVSRAARLELFRERHGAPNAVR